MSVRSRAIPVLTWVSFVVLLPLVALCLLRVAHVDEAKLIVLAMTFLSLVLLPAYFVFVFAVAARKRALGVLAAFVMFCHVSFTVPEWRPPADIPDGAAAAPHLRLFTHNVLFDNPNPQLAAAQIRRSDADVVFLQEISYSNMRVLQKEGAFEGYEYSAISRRLGTSGIGLWSRLPLRDVETTDPSDMSIIRATVDIEGKPVRLYNVHVMSPVASANQWRKDLAHVQKLLAAERLPVLLGGDFNSVYTHRQFRDLLVDGYREANMDRGRGYARSWPAGSGIGRSVGGLIRIDHVITSPGLRTLDITEGSGAGSDHRALTADIAVLDSPR